MCWSSNHKVVGGEGSCPRGDVYQIFFHQWFLFQFMLGPMDFSDTAIVCSRLNSCWQQNLLISLYNIFSLGLFLWKNSNDLNMFFKPQPGLGLKCPICAGLLLSIACQGTQGSGWKKQKRTNYVKKVIVRLYSITYCCFENSPSFPKHPSKYFLWNIR